MASHSEELIESGFYIKAVLICFAVWLILFELVGRYACGLEYIDVTTSFDEAIPLVPQFVWIYQVCYVLPLLIIFLIKDLHRVNLSIMSFFMVSMFSFIIYILYPVGFERPELGHSISDKLLALQYSIDFQPSANKLPSLHCALSVILILASRNSCYSKALEWLVAVLCTGIIVSTVFVKQHIIFDVITGVIAGIIVWILLKKYYDKKELNKMAPDSALIKLLRSLIPVFVLLLSGLIISFLISIK
ncbi:MAG: phosphatase PAP2 family protein [Saprospiraceae bacterium]|nr:phosphatase PAP2 family protein [Saprospiraceae bacterium]